MRALGCKAPDKMLHVYNDSVATFGEEWNKDHDVWEWIFVGSWSMLAFVDGRMW